MLPINIIVLIAGLAAGIIWEAWATAKIPGGESLLPSLIIPYKGKKIHLHHWLTYAAIEVCLVYWVLNFNTLDNPLILFFLAFFLAATLTNIKKFPDWENFKSP